jgi:hypothetical protein
VIFVATKKVGQQFLFDPSLLLLFLDPGSEIRDKLLVSATLSLGFHNKKVFLQIHHDMLLPTDDGYGESLMQEMD